MNTLAIYALLIVIGLIFIVGAAIISAFCEYKDIFTDDNCCNNNMANQEEYIGFFKISDIERG